MYRTNRLRGNGLFVALVVLALALASVAAWMLTGTARDLAGRGDAARTEWAAPVSQADATAGHHESDAVAEGRFGSTVIDSGPSGRVPALNDGTRRDAVVRVPGSGESIQPPSDNLRGRELRPEDDRREDGLLRHGRGSGSGLGPGRFLPEVGGIEPTPDVSFGIRSNSPRRSLPRLLRLEPVLDSNGTIQNYRVFPRPQHALLFDGLGLAGGDLVTAINGAPFDGDSIAQLLERQGVGGDVLLNVERDGALIEITVGSYLFDELEPLPWPGERQ